MPALVALLLVVLATRALIAERGGPMRRLEHATPQRAFVPRFSVGTEYHACTRDSVRQANTIPRETCAPVGAPPSSRLFSTPENSSDPVALRASALARLFWWDEKETSLDTAISRLSRALRITEARVPLLVDLSGAHLARAQEAQNPQDLFEGLEFALEALEREPRSRPALFNAALALQALGLDEQAAHYWDRYLAVDSASPWANEAREKKRGLRTTPVEPPVPGTNASQAVMDAYAAAYPQEARELGWHRVLGDWGEAVVAGDASRADSLLAFAERLGRALERRQGGDASLADAVTAIRDAGGDAAEKMRLARAHEAYATGYAHYAVLDDSAALEAFDRVNRIRPRSPVLLEWNALFRAIMLGGYLRQPDEAIKDLRPFLITIDGARHPALAGRTRLVLATLLFRRGMYADSLAHFREARTKLERAGEMELLGSALSTESEMAYEQGDTVTAYTLMYRAIKLLRPYRASRWLHNHFVVMARLAVLGGMPHAALSIHDEDVPVAFRANIDVVKVEALWRRAQALEALGGAEGVARDEMAAVALVDSLDPGFAQNWARAMGQLGRSGPGSSVAMDSAVHYFENGNLLWLIPALTRRADARLAANDLAGATVDLNDLTRRIRDLSAQQESAALRVAIMDRARGLFDKLVMLHVRQNRIADAFWALEQGRISFSPQRASGTAAVRLAAPRGHVALNYGLVRDTLLTWVIREDSIQLLYRPLDRDTFLLAVEQANAGLESGANDEAAQRALQRLYGWLIGPVRQRLGPRETPLVILADGEVAGVPFAALRESEEGRYLVQDHPLRYAPTLADAFRATPAGRDTGEVLLVADPEFDQLHNLGLDRLSGARPEADSIATLYAERDRRRLDGRNATRAAFVERAPAASIIHYAGHAIFDDARPERSHLVLAGADTTGRLTAEAVESLRLDGVRLVVLSACRTLRSREGRSGGFAGLSGALLTAGVDGVVGSLWQVDDTLTQPLMMAFHRVYSQRGDPARALRAAQLWMLSSGNPAHRSPTAWAGFRYTGGLVPDVAARSRP